MKKIQYSKEYLMDRIYQRFQLFQGYRSQDEDQYILNYLLEGIYLELLQFIDEELTQQQKEEVWYEIEHSLKNEEEQSTVQDFLLSYLLKYMSKIPDVAYKLYERADAYICNEYLQLTGLK